MAAAVVERPAAPPPPQQRYQGVQKESAGYRLLSAMGWREGEGLGASKQGIKAHIKVKKKFENWGVGAVEAAEHAQNWTNGMLDFHRVLSNLSEVVSEHARRRASSSSSEDDSDASGGEDKQQEKQRGKQAKKAAQKGGSKKRKQAPPPSSSSSSEDDSEAEGAPKRVKAATHIGRFKKREAAKMVKAYSDHDLAAILGADPFAAAAAAVPEVRAQRRAASSSGYDSDTEASGSDSDDGAAVQQQQQQPRPGLAAQQAAGAAAAGQEAAAAPPKPEKIVVRRPMLAPTKPAAQPAAAQQGREPGWWQVCFHRAGGPQSGVGAAAAKPAAITIHGFSEQDQTNLYNLAHDKATQGRVGLGRSSMPKKVAGARWEGKKTRIADSEDEEEEEEQQQQEGTEVGAASGGVELEREEGLVIILPASKKHLLEQLRGAQQQAAPAPQQQQQQQQKGSERPGPASGKKAKKAKQEAGAAAADAQPNKQDAADDALKRIKWKKAVSGALKAASKAKLKLSKLHKAIVKQQGLPKAHRPAALEALTAFLQQSPKFELKDGVVRAAA